MQAWQLGSQKGLFASGAGKGDFMTGVAIIEDDPVTRVGLTNVIESTADLSLLCAASSVEEFDSRVGERPAVVILDLRLRGGGIDGTAAIEHLVAAGHAILIVSMFEEEIPVIDSIGAGAHGYLTKETEPDEIVRAVRAVAGGRTYFSATVAGFLLKEGIQLTPREVDVLRLVAAGETTLDIARELFIRETTVNGHLEKIRDKTGCRRRADMTRFAIKKGIFSLWRGK